MLPTQILRIFRLVIFLIGLVDIGLIAQYSIFIRAPGIDLDFILWDVKTSYVAALIMTLVYVAVAFISRPRWISSYLRGALMILAPLVLLVTKSLFTHRYMGDYAELEQDCSLSPDIVRCSGGQWARAFAQYMGFNEALCGFVLAALAIVEVIVTLIMDRRTQKSSKLAAQDTEKSLPTV
ncbi:hypothetical protein EC991_004143 [Linnemannia zychae]|nr:hypothetical protein EC991_004143 [Linnemannia zychae]